VLNQLNPAQAQGMKMKSYGTGLAVVSRHGKEQAKYIKINLACGYGLWL
jgi:hypothetical protein